MIGTVMDFPDSNHEVRSLGRKSTDKEIRPLLVSLLRSAQSLHNYTVRSLRNSRLNVPEFEVLTLLLQEDGLTLKEVAERTLIGKTTLTGIADRLEKKGLLKRYNCSEDRRCVRVYLSRRGHNKVSKLVPRYLEELENRLQALPTTDINAAVTVLRQVRDAL